MATIGHRDNLLITADEAEIAGTDLINLANNLRKTAQAVQDGVDEGEPLTDAQVSAKLNSKVSANKAVTNFEKAKATFQMKTVKPVPDIPN